MKKNRRILAVLIAVLMCLMLLAGCNNDSGGGSTTGGGTTTGGNTGGGTTSSGSGGGNTPAPVSPSFNPSVEAEPPPEEVQQFVEHLEISVDNNPVATLDPFSTAGGNPGALWTYIMIYDTLLNDTERGDGSFLPGLATEWTTDDFITFNFKLREGVTFHNGDKFTAKDVEYTIRLAQSERAIGTNAANRWGRVQDINIIDDYNIQLVLNGVNVNFFWEVSCIGMGILNERAITEDPELGIRIGTGAFYVTGFSTMDYIEVARNDNYWGQIPYTKSMTLRFIPEMSTRTIMLQNNEIQLAFALSPEDLPIFQNDPDHFEIFPNFYNNPNTLTFNMEDPITGDINFRRAVASAIDRSEIALVAAGEWGVPADTGTVWGYATEFRLDMPVLPFDLDAAKAYLAESSYNGEEVEIGTAIVTNVRAAEVIQQQLLKAGIKTKINQMDPPSMSAYTAWDNNHTQLVVFLVGMGVSASDAQRVFLPATPWNRGMFVNDRVIELINTAPTITDYKARGDMYREIQEIVAEQLPVVNLFWLQNANVGVKGLGGLVTPPSGSFDLRYLYLPAN